jgi:hypothetical protein
MVAKMFAYIYACVKYIATVKPLLHQARIPEEIYSELYTIKHSFEQLLAPRQISDSPSVQDIVNVALKRLIRDWQDPEKQKMLHEELLEQRRVARSNMGRKKVDAS